MTAHYIADTDGLGLGRPDAEPLASRDDRPIVDLIQALLDSDAAYAVDGDVYFRVRSDPDYGSLSHRRSTTWTRARASRAPIARRIRSTSRSGRPRSPARTRPGTRPGAAAGPGWHIECSAMAEELLGVGFEIHGGGNDLIFPHHENEAAQTRTARGAELTRIWMHNGMLQMGGEKMAKSRRQHRVAGTTRSQSGAATR